MDEQLTISQVNDILTSFHGDSVVWMEPRDTKHENKESIITLRIADAMRREVVDYHLNAVHHFPEYNFRHAQEIGEVTLLHHIYLIDPFNRDDSVRVRLGGKSLIPLDPRERRMYTGAAREAIRVVPLTERLLREILEDIQQEANYYWEHHEETRILKSGDGIQVSVVFPAHIPLEQRDQMMQKIMQCSKESK